MANACARVLAPIFALWFGSASPPRCARVTLVILIVFFNVYQASRKSPDILANARMLACRRH